MAIWNSKCGVESVNGTFEQIILNSVENSVLSRLCPISFNAFPTILQFMEGYVLNIWNSLKSVLRLLKKFRGMFCGRFHVFQIVSFDVQRRSNVPQIDTE